ncbi:MAG TPA: phytanoyl-CoA dioxygenase family protein [Kofleriaceae bacterium]|nr:phytanoyl-CoA dioxygenase family protein [Kofleriaceae bacterium]
MIAPLPLVPAPIDDDARRTRAAEDGFLYVPGLLAPARLVPLRDLVEDVLARRGWLVAGRSDPALRLGRYDDDRWTSFLADVLVTDEFRALGAAPEIVGVIRALVGDEPQLGVGDVCRLVSPGATDLATQPHQDAAYVKDPEGAWTAWLALGACPLALGPLALLPGSHTGGVRAHATITTGAGGTVVGTDIPDDAPWRASDLAAGDVIFFSAFTVHRALPNVTADQLRVSVDYRYRRR